VKIDTYGHIRLKFGKRGLVIESNMLGLKPVKELKEFSGGRKRVVGSIKLFWFLNNILFCIAQILACLRQFACFYGLKFPCWLRFPIVNFFIS